MASKTEITCACGCGRKKMVRTADVKRGWGKYYDKSCKARAQAKNNGGRPKMSKEKRFQCLLEAHEEGRISDEYFHTVARHEYPEFEDQVDQVDAYHTLDVHPFDSEALGQD